MDEPSAYDALRAAIITRGFDRVLELRDGEIRDSVFDPREQLGWEPFAARDLAGGGPEENTRLVERVLGRRPGLIASSH